MRDIIKILAAFALLIGITNTQADQAKPELDALFKTLKTSTNLIEISEVQNKIWF